MKIETIELESKVIKLKENVYRVTVTGAGAEWTIAGYWKTEAEAEAAGREYLEGMSDRRVRNHMLLAG